MGAYKNGDNVDITFMEDAAWRTAITSITVNFPIAETPVIFDKTTAGHIIINGYGQIPFPIMFTIKATGFQDKNVLYMGPIMPPIVPPTVPPLPF